ncbi:hypothetical protein GCM10007291_09820 [Gemmobacter nanjingensis]|uniref:Uncharacterized protein n=1 Tax=Gemmobacter nanjingensis TaxID=488454 RepID=A0ABQ3F8N9_9RHOB|nr:hypothetical protein [Gemmobacter nanjingensis]GHC13945.1 hypothetical protein GCM10007291_09820 [Gemmobacter nanjingensis]
MRRIAALLTIGLLAACQLPAGLGGGKTAPPPEAGVTAAPGAITGGPVTTTTLAPATAASDVKPAAAPDPAPKAAPEAQPGVPPTAAPPRPVTAPQPEPATKTAAQISCEKAGGTWSAAGLSQARTCVRRTRDAGKQCSRESDCEGFCLARSRSCAPVTPLFGCNPILQADGREVTLCLD